MDLQEKLDEVTKGIQDLETTIKIAKEALKAHKKLEKGYLKLIEGAKSLEQK